MPTSTFLLAYRDVIADPVKPGSVGREATVDAAVRATQKGKRNNIFCIVIVVLHIMQYQTHMLPHGLLRNKYELGLNARYFKLSNSNVQNHSLAADSPEWRLQLPVLFQFVMDGLQNNKNVKGQS